MEVIINGEKFQAQKGETVLTVIERNGFRVPTLCYHSDNKICASCRICVVSVGGKLIPACSSKVEEGMVIDLDTEEAKKARKTNLELLFSQHQEECDDCIWKMNCKMLELAKEFGVTINRFTDRKKNHPVYSFGNALEYDSTKCIDCRNCVDICHKQGVDYMEIQKKGHSFEIVPSASPEKDCIYCGQCIIHCPAGAFEAVGEFEEIEKPFNERKKKVIFQIAPATRSTIGEEFDLPYGEVAIEKLVASLKKIGADNVFDVSSGADVTTIEESKEFLEKVEKGELPMMTSCCPAWVRFVEFYYPEFIPNLTTIRSPHIILGGLIKKHIAEQEGLSQEDIMVVSVMPCVAKKHEASREELLIDGVKPVDYVMTTREVGRLLKKHQIDFKNIEGMKSDNPFGEPSGSGVTYGTSGGVMHSAFFNITGQDAEFKDVSKGLRVAEVDYQGKTLRLAIVHGLGNAKKVLEELKNDPHKYDYLEVMACYGGCIGGGGQSVPTDEKIRQGRKSGLCRASGERTIRKAKDNPEVKEIYEKFLTDDTTTAKICHTHFKKIEKNEK